VDNELIKDMEQLGLKLVKHENQVYIFSYKDIDLDLIIEKKINKNYYNQINEFFVFSIGFEGKVIFQDRGGYMYIINKVKHRLRHLSLPEKILVRPCDFFKNKIINQGSNGASSNINTYWYQSCIFAAVDNNYCGVILLKLKKTYAAYFYYNNPANVYNCRFDKVDLKDGLKIYNDMTINNKTIKEIPQKIKTQLIAKMV
jgi:hypothetical protein